jgi:hypothetical protein
MPADTVTIPVAELAALRTVAAAALDWADHRTGADPVLDAVRTHRRVLDPRDPGDYLAWPDQDRDREPVPGLDYLPVGTWEYDTDGEEHGRHEERRITVGSIPDGFDPAPEMTEHYAALAQLGAAA